MAIDALASLGADLEPLGEPGHLPVRLECPDPHLHGKSRSILALMLTDDGLHLTGTHLLQYFLQSLCI